MKAGSGVKATRSGAVVDTATTTLEGLVVRTESGFHRVLIDDDRVIVCRAPKRLLDRTRTTTTAVVIGDHVRIRLLQGDTGLIEEVLPRNNELVRGAAGGSRYLDVIAANLDLLVVVHSLAEPDFNAGRIDRFLVMAEAAEIPALLCLNKFDLVTEPDAREAANLYRSAGYTVVLTSARTGLHVDELQGEVRDKVSALVGPSGVGKSSLLNDIQPGLHLRTAEISESTGKGRHTTTTAELLRLHVGGWVADTPGLREIAIRDVEPVDSDWLFPEFRPFIPLCRFSNCTHREEIGCAVLDAVRDGSIVQSRYRSYTRIFEDLEERRRQEY